MKPAPCCPAQSRDFPTLVERREFLRRLGLAGLGLGLLGLTAQAGDPPASAAELKKLIRKLAAQLGDDDFKIRKAASTQLLAIGKGRGEDAAADEQAKQQVLAELKPLLTAKDPEVAERARFIVNALNPQPKPPSPPARLKGEMPADAWDI